MTLNEEENKNVCAATLFLSLCPLFVRFASPSPWSNFFAIFSVLTGVLTLFWFFAKPTQSQARGKLVLTVNRIFLLTELLIGIFLLLKYPLGYDFFLALCMGWIFPLIVLCKNGQIRILYTPHRAEILLKSELNSKKRDKILCAISPFLGQLIMLGIAKLDHRVFTMSDMGIGIGISLLICISSLPAWFIKQDANPSDIQRAMRRMDDFPFDIYRKFISDDYKDSLSEKVFKYWLSHPRTPLPDELVNALVNVDTTAFDWQNPKEWPF